jgi:hypothetical protein
MTTELFETVRGLMPGRARSNWSLTEAGAGQDALLRIVQNEPGQWIRLTDIPFRMVGLHVEKLLSAAKALAKKGLIDFKSEKGEGDFIRAKGGKQAEGVEFVERDQAAIDKRSMEKYGVKWRTTPSHHKVGIGTDDEGNEKVTKGNPNHPAVGGISGAKQGKLFGDETMKRTGPEKGWDAPKPSGKKAGPYKPQLQPKSTKDKASGGGGGGGGGGEPKKKLPTFKKAQEAHLDHFASKGWSVKTGLKVPHATSPDGKTRLWFKSQSVHVSKSQTGKGHNLGDSRSTWLDPREHSPESLHAHATKRYGGKSESKERVQDRIQEIRQTFEEQRNRRPVTQKIAEIRDVIHRGPSWSYPDWALPKNEISEEG